MIGTVLWASWRERLSRPVLMVLMVIGGASMFVASVAGLYDELMNPAGVMTLIFAVGSIGRDVSSGTLALVFSRPIERWQYVIAKWLAAGIAASAASLLHLVVQFLVLHALKKGLPVGALFEMVFESTASAFGLAAVLVLLSSLVPGLADFGIWVAVRLIGGLSGSLGVPQQIREHLDGLTSPELAWVTIVSGGTGSWVSMASYASTVTLCLAIVVAVMNRKELSYASG